MDIQPITNEEEHAKALAIVDTLVDAAEGSPEGHALDALLTLIEAFEQKTWPLDSVVDPVGLLRQAMTPEVGHSRSDLIKIVGSASRVSEILAKRRPLTLEAIRAISAAWGIPVALLTQKYDLAPSIRKTPPTSRRANQRRRLAQA